MLQEIFGGRLIGKPEFGFTQLDPGQLKAIAGIAAGFIGLLSLANIIGRFFWASVSDKIGRKRTYATFFALGIVLYAAAPWAAHLGSLPLFALIMIVILSMYGGGFATVPAYLADIFGTKFVGAIHGRLLTAWSVAVLIGANIVDYVRTSQIAAGVPRDQAYDKVMYALAGLLVVGFVCNLLVRPVAPRRLMTEQDLAALDATARRPASQPSGSGIGRGGFSAPALLAWLVIAIPLAWGLWRTLKTVAVLFS
jgi:MFS family permease